MTLVTPRTRAGPAHGGLSAISRNRKLARTAVAAAALTALCVPLAMTVTAAASTSTVGPAIFRPSVAHAHRIEFRARVFASANRRVVLTVASPRMTNVVSVRLLVANHALASFRPGNGVFRGAYGSVSAQAIHTHRLRVTVQVSQRHTTRSMSTVVFISTSPGPAARISRGRTPPKTTVTVITSTQVVSIPVVTTTTPVVSIPVVTTTTQVSSLAAGGHSVYWGAWIDGSQWGYGNAPWDPRATAAFTQEAGKAPSIIHWGEPWYRNGAPVPFYAGDFNSVRNSGAIPMVDWASWDSANGGGPSQSAFTLGKIISGNYDSFIRSWATQAKAWGHPLFLRFDWEMNASYYPWSERANGNSAGQYVHAWRHVHDIFKSVGASNVTWVWCPNTDWSGAIPLTGLFPGSNYVDWVGVDGYNFGTNPIQPDRWNSFAQVFGHTYSELTSLAPTKPIMIGEFASTEYGGSKANWITDALTTQIPNAFPRIAAAVWFDWNDGNFDWTINSSSSAQAAFANGISSPVYQTNQYSNISSSPIAPPQ